MATLEALADAFLARDDLVRLVAWQPVDPSADQPPTADLAASRWLRYTTHELLALEADLLRMATARRATCSGTVRPAQLATALSDVTADGRQLDDDQRAMVTDLLTTGDGVAIINAPAGAGKTFALRVCRQAWQAAGYHVVGAALAAQAAQVLTESTGMPATTIARLLLDLDATSGLQPDSVLIIDEAGMVPTRTLGRLLEHATRAKAKLVLVGDTQQLPELGAGGLFRGLWARLGRVGLTGNHRQRHPWERHALQLLRTGNAADAVALYAHHRRIITRRTADQVADQLIDDWYHAVQHQPSAEPAPMILAARRADVADLNARARRRLAVDGRLGPHQLWIGNRAFAIGDRVITLKNAWRTYRVLNGTRGTITDINIAAGSIQVRTDDGRPITLPPAYLTPRGGRRRMDHAYATTGHKAQGVTGGHVYILATDELYQQWGYTALSRGTATNTMYYTADRPPDPDLDHPKGPPDSDHTTTLAAALAHSRAQSLASDHLRHPNPSTLPSVDNVAIE